MLAVLWTRVPEAALSHETALDAYGISDVNPSRIHLTVGKHRCFPRAGGDYVVYYEDVAPSPCCRRGHSTLDYAPGRSPRRGDDPLDAHGATVFPASAGFFAQVR